MSDQLELMSDPEQEIPFELYGESYKILHDSSRDRLSPKWFVQRMSDLRTTKRYYSWPDGAFAAVFWQRCSWVD